jgi:hypothetical protein
MSLIVLISCLIICYHIIKIPLESIIETHGTEGINVIISLEFNMQTLNTGALLLRNTEWTYKMLEAWHKVGFADLWGHAELSEWGLDFYEVKPHAHSQEYICVEYKSAHTSTHTRARLLSIVYFCTLN